MGAGVTETDVVRLVGAVGPLLMHEVLRTGASLGELRRAVAICGSAHRTEARLPPRMRRLVDLIGVAGQNYDSGTAA